jgi:Domain of unknown function (DUF4189)
MIVTPRSARAWAILAILAGAALALLAAVPAAAQSRGRACPGGPGPGERQVGNSPQAGAAAVPLCAPDGSNSENVRLIDNYYAAAWHADASGAWIVAGYTAKDRADRAALAACNKAMGGGCALSVSNANGTVAIARGAEGALYAADHAAKAAAENIVRAWCRKQGDACEVIGSVTIQRRPVPFEGVPRDKPELFAPPGNPRRVFGAVAWLDGAELGERPWFGDVWVVGARPSAEQARTDALALCRAEMPVGCSAGLVASDVFVAVAARGDVSIAAGSGFSRGLAERQALAQCRGRKGGCRIAATIDLTKNQAYRFDPFAQGMPYFTAQAWTRAAETPRAAVWSASGARSAEDAERAAITACANDSQQACELASHSFNSRVSVAIDEQGNLRIAYTERDTDPATLVGKQCAEAGAVCTVLKEIDAREPVTARIAALAPPNR